MRFNRNVTLVVCALSSLAVAGPPKAPDLAATAEKIVGDVLGVKAGEVVVIEADPADKAMVDELFVAIGKRGASPLPRIGWPQLQKKCSSRCRRPTTRPAARWKRS